jgi:hypothetical protein
LAQSLALAAEGEEIQAQFAAAHERWHVAIHAHRTAPPDVVQQPPGKARGAGPCGGGDLPPRKERLLVAAAPVGRPPALRAATG